MMRKEDGFTLVELLVTMVVFVFVMAAGSQIFSGLLTQFKQQSKIAETNIEGLVGLEILRQDLEHIGYGLPWLIPAGTVYSEAPASNPSHISSPSTAAFDDAPSNAPRACVSADSATYGAPNDAFSGSDYLVIKATNIVLSETAQRWTILKMAPFGTENPRQWTPASENLSDGSGGTPLDRVIVITPGSTDANARRLIVDGAAFYTTFNNVTSSPWPPTDNVETRLVYGINNTNDPAPLRPFNRADYFITSVDNGNSNIVPQRCATNTGVLVKAIANHSGTYDNVLPLLDCVATMQIMYRLDMDNDGTVGTCSNADGSTIATDVNICPGENSVAGTPVTPADVQATLSNAADLRTRLREIRVFILAHEGQRDVNYTYPSNTVAVGELNLGVAFDLTAITDWQDYRWKVYSISVNPINLLR